MPIETYAEEFISIMSDIKIGYSYNGDIVQKLIDSTNYKTKTQYLNGQVDLDDFKNQVKLLYLESSNIIDQFELAFEDFLISNLSNWVIRDVISTKIC